MRILHVIDSLAQGGAERMLVDLANAATRDGHAVVVVVTRQDTRLARDLAPSVTLYRLGRARRFDLGALRRFAAIVRDEAADVIHVHGRSTFSFACAAKSIDRVPAPLLLHDHYGSIEVDQRVPLWMIPAARLFLNAYVGIHPLMADWARHAGIPESRTFLVDNALDLSRLNVDAKADAHALFGLDQQDVIGLFVGGIRREKGLDVLINALARLDGAPPFRIVIAGGERDATYATACRAQAERLRVADRLVFAGERDDVPALLRSVDFAVLPSRSESGPLTLIEVLHAGLPFVATRSGSIAPRLAQLGLPGIVAPNDAAALAEALTALLRLSPEERRERGARGVAIVAECYDVRAVMPRWYEIYEQTSRAYRS